MIKKILLALAFIVALTIIIFLMDGESADISVKDFFDSEVVHITINTPIPDTLLVKPPVIPVPPQMWTQKKVIFGDTFLKILQGLSIPRDIIDQINDQIYNYVKVSDFRAGDTYSVMRGSLSSDPVLLEYPLDDSTLVNINLINAKVDLIHKEVLKVILTTKCIIQSSLIGAIIDSGGTEDLANKILSVFAWKIDFNKLNKGDEFTTIYEQLSIDGEVIGSGKIHAISFKHGEEIFEGFLYNNGNGSEYFDAYGMNMSHAPLIFDQITSLYANRRFHPTQRRYKPHYGMDFEAKEGTPVESTFDGVVTKATYGRANGNNVKIQHTKDLSTQYLHFSKIEPSIHIGDNVKRGQVIGYVGSTGYSSGPHLCLRLWYKNQQRDPLNYKLIRREDLAVGNLVKFKEKVIAYKEMLNSEN
ncbi:MAG: murein DD-endopeptidase MepM/ murein hydrolase activator NlpD [Marinoscillum sp.]